MFCCILDTTDAVRISASLASGTVVTENTVVTFTCQSERNPPGRLSLVMKSTKTVVKAITGNYLEVKLTN